MTREIAIKGRKPSGNWRQGRWSPQGGMIVYGRQRYQIRKFPDLSIVSNVSISVMAKTFFLTETSGPQDGLNIP
jgi:hypothetical protein